MYNEKRTLETAMKIPDWAKDGLKVIFTKPDPVVANSTVDHSGTLTKGTTGWFYADDADWSNNHRVYRWGTLRPKEETCSST